MEHMNIGDEEIITTMIIAYKYLANPLSFQGVEIVLALIECFGVLSCDSWKRTANEYAWSKAVQQLAPRWNERDTFSDSEEK